MCGGDLRMCGTVSSDFQVRVDGCLIDISEVEADADICIVDSWRSGSMVGGILLGCTRESPR